MPEFYHEDSLFTLNGWGIAGVLAIATLLGLITFWAVWRISRGQVWALRVVLGVAAFALFEWLSPQIFYEFYRLIFDDLPRQWVVSIPSAQTLLELVTFQGPANLSSHGRGVLFWLVMIVALVAGRAFRRDAAN